MSDEFQFQLSVSLPPSEQFAKGDMVNIRGNTGPEFLQNLLNFDEQMAALAGKVSADIRAQFAVARDLGGRVIEQSRPQNAQVAPQQPQSAPVAHPPAPQQYAPQTGYGQEPPPPPPDPQQYGGYPQQAPQQQYQQQPDPNAVPTQPPPHVGPPPGCSHGQKKFIAKAYRNGKPGYWMAWACPAPQGAPDQHELEFIQTKR